MIAVVYGTTGELIKLAPVLRRLEESSTPTLTLCTGQQVEQIPSLLGEFGLRQPEVWLAQGSGGHDLERVRDVPRWLVEVAANFARTRRSLLEQFAAGSGRPLVLIHGDTITTVLGAAVGRSMHVPVAPIEAGMRSR